MRKNILQIILICLSSPAFSQTGIQFFQGSWTDVKIKAKTENKKIYVDCYTSWCGPCKRMEHDIFTDTAVSRYYNEHYLCYRMDMESGEGPPIANQYDVHLYPTHLYFNSQGDLVHRESGFKEAAVFLQLGKDGIDPETQSGQLWFNYEKGNRDPGFLLEYTEYLYHEKLNYADVFDQYIISVEKEPVDSNFLKTLFKYTSRINTKAFQLFQQYQPKLKEQYGDFYLGNKYKLIIVPNSINLAAKTSNDSLYHVVEKLYLDNIKITTNENPNEDLLYPYLRKTSQYQLYFDTLEYFMQRVMFDNRTFDEMTRLVKEQPDHELLRNADNGREVRHIEPRSSAISGSVACVEYYNTLANELNGYAFYFVNTPDAYNHLSEGTLKWIKLALAIQERNKIKDAPVFDYYEAYAKIYAKIKDYENALFYAKKAEEYARKHNYPSDEMLEIMDLVQEIKSKM